MCEINTLQVCKLHYSFEITSEGATCAWNYNGVEESVTKILLLTRLQMVFKMFASKFS